MALHIIQHKIKHLAEPHLGYFLMFLMHYVSSVLRKQKAEERDRKLCRLEGCQFFFVLKCHINYAAYSPHDKGRGSDMKGPVIVM